MIRINNIELNNNLVLAPMAGYTDAAFRVLCREQGAALTYTEMISAKALYYRNKNTLPLLTLLPEEGPTVLQLFGDDPELLAQEAQKLEDSPYVMFDVNMACPVPKVVNNGEGSALMLEPAKVGAIVKKMTDTLKKPVSVKIRKGFDDEHINAVEIARIAQDHGAALVAVHGRTRQQMYHGKADYDIIRQVKEAVDIPVLGSGDIYTREDALRMLEETGVDGVMIARGSRGNPWIFRQILEPHFEQPSLEEVKDMARRQLELMIAFYLNLPDRRLRKERNCMIKRNPDTVQSSATERVNLPYDFRTSEVAEQTDNPDQRLKVVEALCVRQMRKHMGFYSQGYPNSAAFRREINLCETREQFLETLTLWNA